MKKILSWLLVLCMICSLLPASVFAASTFATSGDCSRDEDSNVRWNFDMETRTLTISGEGYMRDYDSCAAEYDPNFAGNYNTRPWDACLNDVSIWKVIVEEGVQSIGCRAFCHYDCIDKVVLPESLEWIGEEAFSRCYSLEFIGIPEGVESIGISAFAGDFNLKTVVLSEGLTMISTDMFNGCYRLTDIIIPTSVTDIDDSAFYECTALSSVIYNGGTEKWNNIWIGSNNTCLTEASVRGATFSGTLGNDATWELVPWNGVLTIRGTGAASGTPWKGMGNLVRKVVIEEGITQFSEGYFCGFDEIEEISLPNTLTFLPKEAFADSNGFSNVTIPGSVTSMGAGSFENCTGLKTVTVEEGVQKLFRTFQNCTALTTIHLPVSMTSISADTFNGCTALSDVYYAGSKSQWDAIAIGTGNDVLQNATIHFAVADEPATSGTCGAEGENLTWSYDPETCTLTISGSGAMATYDQGREVPWAEFAENITSIVFDGNVTSIGDYAFAGFTSLEAIVIPNSVTRIGGGAFRECPALKQITLHPGITYMGDKMFTYSEALEIVYFNGTEAQWQALDKGNGNTILDSVEVIPLVEECKHSNKTTGRADATCTENGSVTVICVDCGEVISTEVIPATGHSYTYTNNGEEHVVGCNNCSYSMTEEHTYAEGSCICGAVEDFYSGTCGDNLTWRLDVESGILAICGEGAMTERPWSEYKNVVRAVYLDHGVTSLAPLAFENFSELESLVIPVTLTEFGKDADYGCVALFQIFYSGTEKQWDALDKSQNNYIDNCETVYCDFNFGLCGTDEDIVIWGFENDAGILAFDGRGKIADQEFNVKPWHGPYANYVNICDGITGIGVAALYGVSGIYSIMIPKSVQEIGDYAVAHATKLEVASFEEGVPYIGNYMFGKCANLKAVCIPVSVERIGTQAFSNCTSLTDIYYAGTEEQWNTVVIESGNEALNTATIHFLSMYGSCGKISESLTWMLDTETMEMTIYGYGDMSDGNIFAYNCDLLGLTIGEHVTGIGKMAFHCACNLKEVVIPDSVTKIEEDAFSFCANLEKVTIGKNVETIGEYAFYECSSLKEVTIPISVQSIAKNAFAGGGLDSLYYEGTEDQWQEITGGDINLPGVAVYFNAKEGNRYGLCGAQDENLTWTFDPTTGALTIGGVGDMAEEFTFNNNCAIQTLTIGKYVTSISAMAFHCACNLTEVVIPDSVTSIGEDAFSFCERLHRVTLSKNLDEISTGVFYNSCALTELYIPDGVTSIGAYAFGNCSSLAIVMIPASVNTIAYDAFSPCSSLNHVLYGGTEAQWDSLDATVSDAVVHCNATGDEVYWAGNEGYKYLYCGICRNMVIGNNCDHADSVVNGHADPTCTKDGYTAYSCVTCGYSYAETIPATGHVNTTTTTVDATCTENGSITVTCACGKVVSVEVIPTPGHIYDVIITEPTCTEDGYTTYDCSVCGDTYTSDIVPATGHVNTTTTTVEATCTEDGSITVTCACGEVVSVETIDALGHNYSKTVTAPTCTEDGYTTYTCDRCGDTYTADVVPATGHSYTYTNNGEDHTVGCGNCDYSAVESHTYVDGTCICGAVEVVEPTQANIKIGHGVALESDLCVKYRVKYSDLSAAVPNYVTDGAYLVIEKDVYPAGGEKTVVTYELEADLVSDPARMVFNLAGIQSAEMGSELRAVLHVFDAEGREYISAVDVYSIKTYVETTLKNVTYETQPKMVTMLIDLLNYGAAAQISFGRRTDELVNAGFEAYQQYATTELSAPLTDSKDTVSNDRTITAVTKMGFSVNLADKTEINAKLTLAAGYTMEDISKVVILNEAGEQVDVITEFALLEDGRVQVTFSGVKSINMRDMFYFVAYVGEEVASDKVGYSVEAAAKTSIATGTGSNVDAMRACMYYGDSACAYFGK